tara:strand:- start:267 stop:614 length:348 start_codon:yes stop_codon:yes gene_type:complete
MNIITKARGFSSIHFTSIRYISGEYNEPNPNNYDNNEKIRKTHKNIRIRYIEYPKPKTQIKKINLDDYFESYRRNKDNYFEDNKKSKDTEVDLSGKTLRYKDHILEINPNLYYYV